jgi:hypothetical protein
MATLIRIVYISRSTFASSTGNDGIDPGLARILAKSRKNNRDANIVGGLLFGDGHFLQCLEGAPAAVDRLFKIIAADPRHKDVKTLLRVPIERLSFSAWSMKYVPMEQPLRRLLAVQGLTQFDPYNFTQANLQAVLMALQTEHDPSQNYAPSILNAAAATVAPKPTVAPKSTDTALQARAAVQRPVPANSALARANWALGISILSLVLVVIAVSRRFL